LEYRNWDLEFGIALVVMGQLPKDIRLGRGGLPRQSGCGISVSSGMRSELSRLDAT
jgi:hypothetical protein